MSWDKNTVLLSKLDAVRLTLGKLSIDCVISVIGSFKGRGINDDPHMDGTVTTYELRRLEFPGWVILEYVELDADCDVDDIIASREFPIEDEPKDWQAIRYTDKTGDYPDWEGIP